MEEKTLESFDRYSILRNLGSLESTSGLLADPFDPSSTIIQAASADPSTYMVEVTAFQSDVSSLEAVSTSEIQVETLSEASIDLLRSLGQISPALALIKKT
jgi:hypothetical protein